MKKLLISSLLVSTAILIGDNTTYAEKLKVKPEVFTPTQQRNAAPVVKLRSAQAGISPETKAKSVSLPVLTTDEIASVQPAGKKRPIQIGVNRSLDNLFPNPIDLDQLDWQPAGQGTVASILISSEQAKKLRLYLQVDQIPQSIELRFFEPSDIEKQYTVFSSANIKTGEKFWSPSVLGDQMGLEIYVPNGINHNDLIFSILDVSHIFQGVSTPLSESPIPSLRAASESCNIDIACASQNYQDMGKSVAKIIYSTTAGSYLCTGTLIADNDAATQVPYFLTANHCIDNAASAASIEFFWFYRNQQCGVTSVSSDYTTTQGGAELLANSPSTDFSFVRINNNPPAGVGMSGWSLTPLEVDQDVVGLHHPNGDVKKYSKGKFKFFESITDTGQYLLVTPDENGNFMSVKWSEGITAGGSSGSGLWREEQGVNYLVGALFGGSSFCSAPNAPDDYGRFDRTYTQIKQWLDPSPQQININVTTSGIHSIALKDGILLARYIQGLRGSALLEGVAESENSSTIESRLADIYTHVDINNDGAITAEEDAMIIMRHMMGFEGDSLVSGLITPNSTRTNPTDIKQFLEGFITGETPLQSDGS